MSEDKIILNELISIDSQCSKSNEEIHEYIMNRLRSFQLSEYAFIDGNLRLFNLIAKIEGKSSSNPLVFFGHTDTVGDSPSWNGQAFNPVEKDGKIYGLGSSDMKSGLACMMAAALSLKKTPERDIYLMFDADEEGSGTGGKELVQNVNLTDARIIVGEPTEGKIILSHRGCLDLEILVRGKEKHSGQADSEYIEKNNAIYKMSSIIESLRKYGKEIESRCDDIVGRPSFNIGAISGGKGANTVAGDCTIKVCRRIIPGENLEQEMLEIEDIVRRNCQDFKLRPTFTGLPFKASKESNIVKSLTPLVERHYGKVEYDVSQGCTEAPLFSRFGQVVIFGPGTRRVMHKPNEYVEISNLNKFTEIYRELMIGE